ncbi:tetratricopeptide repeat protein [Sphingomonas sp. CFBP 8760]|nr:tetratricopeptide repeat protein [Sphingomonas sp. CFBP 8760]
MQQAKLLQARDDIASRSAERLNTAIATLQTPRAQVPADPDVREALAEGYLLSREFGSLPDALAMGNARREAMAALRWGPRSATALRVLGVVAYWWDRDPAAAGRLFHRAIDAALNDALVRQCYANILADNGEHAAAIREFDAARRLAPGATYLIADYAWGLWSAGREEEARALLNDLVRQEPMLASAHDCLSVIAFAADDLPGYAHYLHLRAKSRAAPELAAYSGMIKQEVVCGDRAAVYRAMFSRALSQAKATSQSDHSWAAFIASSFGDRTQLIDVLRRSQQRSERWGASGYKRRIGKRWSADETIQQLLASLNQSRIEPPPSDSTI